jgi:hypothetical protein
LINGDWIGAFALPSKLDSDEKEYVVVAKMDGGKIIPWTDKVLTKKEVEELIPDLKSMMLTNDSSVQVYGILISRLSPTNLLWKRFLNQHC